MPTAQECRAYAEECRRLARVSDISIDRATLLTAISQTWETSAVQIETLARY
jgi:hypothetical protein